MYVYDERKMLKPLEGDLVVVCGKAERGGYITPTPVDMPTGAQTPNTVLYVPPKY